jgi:acyl carrier protein
LRPLFDEMRSRPRIQNEAQISSKSAASQPEFRLQLQNASPTLRRSILVTLLRSQISSILGFDLSREIELEQGLFDMGMDSLMSVELKGRLERSLEVPLPSTLTFNYPTIKALVDYLLSDALEFHSPPAQETPPSPPAPTVTIPGVTASDDLSEEELSELLLKKLAELE